MRQSIAAAAVFPLLLIAIPLMAQRNSSKPEIIGQNPSPMVTTQGNPVIIQLTNLIVRDEDGEPPYPNGYSLDINPGRNYRVVGNIVFPDWDFTGRLEVRVRVDDGKDKSNWFDFEIDVQETKNDPPRITGQSPLSVQSGQSLTIDFGHLRVSDSNDPYPSGFSLKVFEGNNYSVNGTTITPEANFSGNLRVPVSVNDGESESNRFELKVDVIKATNVAPQITGQVVLSVNPGASLTIGLQHLLVVDPDDNYPDGFSLKIFGGNNYTFSGTTITPKSDFSGILQVPVTVSDGKSESNRFELKINVINTTNVAPQITGQVALSVNQGASLTIGLQHLVVVDPDSNYPDGFTLKIFGGNNYTFSGTTITPKSDFSGILQVPVTVSDGKSESNRFELKINVINTTNVAPQITGQVALSVNQGASLTIGLQHLLVVDPDSNYPDGFSLKIFAGNNYTFSGTTITPKSDFSGILQVPVTVSDGKSESNRFELKINVINTTNVAPQITGQVALSTNQGASLTIGLQHLIVVDPDSNYPTGFSLKIFPGDNYTINGPTVTPGATFSGMLYVPVSVNDGVNESNRFELKVNVVKAPDASPVITGQVPLAIGENASLTIVFEHLYVTDADDIYPDNFTINIFSGTNYVINGNTITPSQGFSGVLSVPVTVNDGEKESNKFNLVVQVRKTNVAPIITGQVHLQFNEDEAITLQIANLIITDPDNPNLNNLVLKISNGANYTVNGLTITPAKNFSGVLTVSVQVNDGQWDSEVFFLKIIVLEVNDAPMITGQIALSIDKNTSTRLLISDFTIIDPDDSPEDFTLQILNGSNYSVVTNIVSPVPGFTGELEVTVVVGDGKISSPPFKAKVNVIATEPNDIPVIVAQKPISIVQDVSLTLQLSHLVVNDSDDEYPQGFTLMVLPGNNYSVDGTTVTPKPNLIGLITVSVKVNDGRNDSAPFSLKINILPPASKPNINGQRELTVLEDSAITISLTDLFVTDSDHPNYPKGFTLLVLSGKTYTKEGNTITPLQNLNGFIEVGVLVSDGDDFSNEYKVSVFVVPVNDPPEIINFDTTALAYEPGNKPLSIFKQFRIRDVDSEQLLMAEIGFESENYTLSSDQLAVNSDSSKIRVVHGNNGILYLIGYASIEEYQRTLQAVQYNYEIIADEQGNPTEIPSGPRTFYITLFDGLTRSSSRQRQIHMEVQVQLDIPNAFTPNGDNTNDTWQLRPTNTDRVDDAIIRVYNRQGLLVYECIGFNKKWDGFHNGQALPVDTYFYTIDLNLHYTKKTYKGTVTLLH